MTQSRISKKRDVRTKELKGRKFYRLTVTEYAHSKEGQTFWTCLCECGNKTVVRRSRLIAGGVRSCGCYNSERASKWLTKYANSEAHRGKGNPQWKGEGAGYSSFHGWLARHYVKERCEQCGSKKNLDWALKKGLVHSHRRENYMILCRKHHIEYDYAS